jgi:hypothetical protein
MHPARNTWVLFVLAIFWVAQVHGTVHAIGHLPGPESAAKRTLLVQGSFCAECAGLSQAGAAPLPAPPASLALPSARDSSTVFLTVALSATPYSFYQSRAPPRTSV